MSKEIEEMAEIIATSSCIGIYCSDCEFNSQPSCNQRYKAKAIYTAGYRKQSENTVEVIRCKDCLYCEDCSYIKESQMRY